MGREKKKKKLQCGRSRRRFVKRGLVQERLLLHGRGQDRQGLGLLLFRLKHGLLRILRNDRGATFEVSFRQISPAFMLCNLLASGQSDE